MIIAKIYIKTNNTFTKNILRSKKILYNIVSLTLILNMNNIINARTLSKLKWRARRGLLENDIIITKFFDKYGASLTNQDALALEIIFDLSDNDLLELILQRKPIPKEWLNNLTLLDIMQKLQQII